MTPSSKKYTRRSNKSEVVFHHGDTKSLNDWSSSRDEVLLRVEGTTFTENDRYRYMFQKLQDRAYGWLLIFSVVCLLRSSCVPSLVQAVEDLEYWLMTLI